MQSFQLIRAFTKCGLLPIQQEEEKVKANWFNGWFLVINILRLGVFGFYMYFTVLELLEAHITVRFAIMVFARIMGSIGGVLCPILLTFTAKRLGPEACNGMAIMPCKAWLIIFLMELLFYTGAVIIQLPVFFEYSGSRVSIGLFASSEVILLLVGISDYFTTFSVTFLWTLDLKLKIKNLLREYSKVHVNELEEILTHYSDLKYAFEPFCFTLFSLVQILCIASIYLAMSGSLFSLIGLKLLFLDSIFCLSFMLFYLKMNQSRLSRQNHPQILP